MNINNVGTVGGIEAQTQTTVKNDTAAKAAQQNQATEVQQNDSRVETTKEMAKVLDEMMSDLGTNLGFTIREDMDNQVIVEVKNKSTNELIRQIPSEELLQIMEKMEALSGMIFDGTV